MSDPASGRRHEELLGDGVVDAATDAPRIGEVLATPRQRLDGANPLRLPTVCSDAGAVGGYWLAAASLAGLRHLQEGETGQDSYSFAATEDGRGVVAAVADGLGSRRYSHVGATIAARAACHELARRDSTALLEGDEDELNGALTVANNAVRAIHRTWWTDEIDVRELSTTLAGCLLSTDPTEPALVFRVGDSGAITIGEDGSFRSVFELDDGPLDVVRGILPLRESEAVNSMVESVTVDHQCSMVLVTDGVLNDVACSPAVRTWLERAWMQPCGAFAFLDSLRYRRQTSHDDRTALAVWHYDRPQGGEGLSQGAEGQGE